MIKLVFSSVMLLCLTLGQASAALAQQTRAEKWEPALRLTWTDSGSVDGSQDSAIEFDSAVGLGFGISYNLNESIALGFDLNWTRPDYTATLDSDEDGPYEVDHELTMFSGQFKGTWNLLKGPFTPYLEAGIGWNYTDSNVAKGPPSIGGCWWDPWYGRVCSRYQNSYSETKFAYSYGAGLRYEMGNGMFIKGGYTRMEIDSNVFDPSLDSARLELGWIY